MTIGIPSYPVLATANCVYIDGSVTPSYTIDLSAANAIFCINPPASPGQLDLYLPNLFGFFDPIRGEIVHSPIVYIGFVTGFDVDHQPVIHPFGSQTIDGFPSYTNFTDYSFAYLVGYGSATISPGWIQIT